VCTLPVSMRRIHTDELRRLDRYARQNARGLERV
jgi:hypothetical protein